MHIQPDDQTTESTQNIEDASVLEWLFVGSAAAKLLDSFVTYKDFDYSETQIAQTAGISLKTALQIIPKLESVELISYTRRVGRAKMYRLNQYSKVAKALRQFVFEVATKRIDDALGNEQTLQERITIHEPEQNTGELINNTRNT